ncbi:MAG: hypothetical protein PHR45_02715 [Muribaculaceae bacterium]|nr:hypothetical protein [Muribaculaceae bacterium]
MSNKVLTTLEVSTELFHVEPLQHYIGYLAQYCQVPSNKQFHLSILIEEIFTHIIKEAFNNRTDGTITISAELNPANFVLKFHYLGIPFGYSLETAESIEDNISNTLIRKLSTSYKMTQQGKDGQTIEINIALPEYEGAHIVHNHNQNTNTCDIVLASDKVLLREIEEADMQMLVQCLYEVFGYTYSSDGIYYPEVILERLHQGVYRGFVAENEAGKVVAHVAMLKNDPTSKICECGQAFVSPEYGKRGLFNKLKQLLIDAACKECLYGVTSSSVTEHIFSQKVNIALGCVETGLSLAYAPLKFKSVVSNNVGVQRQAVIGFFYSCNGGTQDIYIVPQHSEFIAKTYKNLGIFRNFKCSNISLEDWTDNSQVELQIKTDWNQIYISISLPGKDLSRRIINLVRQGIVCGAAVAYIELPLTSIDTPLICEILENVGFFYSGITPYEMNGADSIKMQYVIDTSISPEYIHTASEWGAEIKDYVFKSKERAESMLKMPI